MLPRRPISIIALTAVTCGCAVAVANGQVSVPQVNVPSTSQPLQDLPSVPSAPSVPNVTVPQTQLPSVKTPSGQTPSVKLPSTNELTSKAPSVKTPSLGGSGAGGGSSGSVGSSGSAGRNEAASSGASARTIKGRAAVRAANRRAARRNLTPRQHAVRRERGLRRAARQLEGCLPALPSFERQVIVLRGGLHGRRPLTRTGTARRLHVGSARVRAAERSGLTGLRRADAAQGCGLKSSAGRRAAALRLATGSAPTLEPLPVAAPSPALVATNSLERGKHRELGAQAESSPSSHKREPETRRAGLVPTSGDEDSSMSPIVWIAILAALALAGVGLLLFRRRDPYARYYDRAPVSAYPVAWGADHGPVTAEEEPAAASEAESADPAGRAPVSAFPVAWGADDGPMTVEEDPMAASAAESAEPVAAAHTAESDPPGQRRRDRTMQAFGGIAATGAAASLLVGRFLGRRRRR